MQQITWTFPNAEAVIKPGELHCDLDANRSGAGHVIQVVDVYRMYYWGTGSDGYHHICLAETSIDSPNAWKACGSVLDRQPGTEYNDQGNGFPFVVPQKDGPWLMYICGWGTLAPTGNCRTRRVLRSVTTQDRASTIAMKRRF